MSGIDADVFFYCGDVEAVRAVLEFVDRAADTLGRRLGARLGWREQGLKNVLDVGGRGARVLAWQSIVEAEEKRRKDELP